jgi:Tautomerase enzyme
MVGLIRAGRSEQVKRELITGLAEAWSEVTGEPMEDFALFLLEQLGHTIMEEGQILPEASEDAIQRVE